MGGPPLLWYVLARVHLGECSARLNMPEMNRSKLVGYGAIGFLSTNEIESAIGREAIAKSAQWDGSLHGPGTLKRMSIQAESNARRTRPLGMST